MVAVVNAAEALQAQNMIISHRIHVVEVAMFQIFSYYAKSAIEASLIVVHAKYITDEQEQIAVIKVQAKAKALAKRKSRQALRVNVQEQQRKGLDAKTKLRIQMVDAIYIKLNLIHKTT